MLSWRVARPGLKLLEEFGTVDASYDLTPEQLVERIPSCDALIIRSATKVRAFGHQRVSMESEHAAPIVLSTPLGLARAHAGQGAGSLLPETMS